MIKFTNLLSVRNAKININHLNSFQTYIQIINHKQASLVL